MTEADMTAEAHRTMEKEAIRELVCGLGADRCGFAGAERFSAFRPGFGPTDVFAACRTAVVPLLALPKGLRDADARMVYGHFNHLSAELVDRISFAAAREFERRFGVTAVPVPCDGPYEYWEPETKTGRGLVSVKDLAVQAGLGQLGKSTLLLHPEFGNLVTVGAILIDAPLASDPYAETICIPGCRKCIDGCPVHAFGEDGGPVQKLCRENCYKTNARGFSIVDCNRCRTLCPMAAGKGRTQRMAGR